MMLFKIFLHYLLYRYYSRDNEIVEACEVNLQLIWVNKKSKKKNKICCFHSLSLFPLCNQSIFSAMSGFGPIFQNALRGGKTKFFGFFFS